MANVTPIEVEEIYDGIVQSNAVTAAGQISSKLLSDCSYTTAELKEIERWLAAHFQSIIDGKNSLTSESLGRWSESKSNIYSKGLESTEYGQMALALDTCGGLSNAGKRKAIFNVI